MKQEDLDRAARLTADREHYKGIAYFNVCAMCGSSLSVSWNGQLDIYELVCSKDRTHQGYARLKNLYQQWRDGEALPVEVIQALQFKYGKRRKE